MIRKLVALSALCCSFAFAQDARLLRFASAFDPQTMDPHALALLYQSRVNTQIYEGLVNRDKQFKLEP
jgi:peptide/nickel transport system substrate-binding protein